jgi:hypothetical protein
LDADNSSLTAPAALQASLSTHHLALARKRALIEDLARGLARVGDSA